MKRVLQLEGGLRGRRQGRRQRWNLTKHSYSWFVDAVYAWTAVDRVIIERMTTLLTKGGGRTSSLRWSEEAQIKVRQVLRVPSVL